METRRTYAKFMCSCRTRGDNRNEIGVREQGEGEFAQPEEKAVAQHICCGGISSVPSADHCRSGPSNSLILRRIDGTPLNATVSRGRNRF